MKPDELTAALKTEALRLGFDMAGVVSAVEAPAFELLKQWVAEGYAGKLSYFARRLEAYQHPQGVLEGAKSILMLGLNYRTVEPRLPEQGEAQIARYAWGKDYHLVIRQKLRLLADYCRTLVPDVRVRGVVDTAPLLEKQFGKLAGLGWIGKNTLLINPQFGSWFFLAGLLTTVELAAEKAEVIDGCGSCRACVDACPTGALFTPGRLDARRCLSYLSIESRAPVPTKLKSQWGRRLWGCDACQEVCPWNRNTPGSKEQAFQPRPGNNPVKLAEILCLDENEFQLRFGDTPLKRLGLLGIRRNAMLADS